MFRQSKIAVVSIAAACSLIFSACNSNFDIGITSDDHPLLNVSDTYSQTKYPIVLVHGLYGFDDIFGMEYWHDIPLVLENGGTEVYTAIVAGAHSPEVRGEQLIQQLEEFKLSSGSDRFHLMGHSLGGPTIRYAAAKRPDLVISATSVSGANHGSDAANNDTIELPLIRGIVSVMGNMLGHVIDTVSQDSFEQNILAALDAMSTEGILAFNTEYPEGLPATFCNGAENDTAIGFSHGTNSAYQENNPLSSFDDFSAYYPVPAATDGTAAGPYTLNYASTPYEVYFYSFGGNKSATNGLDPLDGLHKAVAKMLEGDDNDGMVERCSTHHGWVIKDNYPMNHLDFMNWFVGLRASDAPYAPSMYRAHGHYLQQLEIANGL